MRCLEDENDTGTSSRLKSVGDTSEFGGEKKLTILAYDGEIHVRCASWFDSLNLNQGDSGEEEEEWIEEWNLVLKKPEQNLKVLESRQLSMMLSI